MQRNASAPLLRDRPPGQRPRLFGEKLTHLTSLTEANLQRLALQLATDDCERQLNDLVRKADASGRLADSGSHSGERLSSSGNPWQNLDTIFTGSDAFGRIERKKEQPHPTLNDDPTVSDVASMNSYCYLCTTQEEHRSHLKSAKKVHGKPKRTYAMPATALPRPRPLSAAQLSVDTSKHEQERPIRSSAGVLYKVTFFSRSFGINEPVYCQIIGSEGKSDVTELTHKTHPAILFLPNAKKTFTVRAEIDLGLLKKIKLRIKRSGDDRYAEKTHRGSVNESLDGWMLDEIRVVKLRGSASGTNSSAGVYAFPAERRLFADPGTVVESLGGQLLPENDKEYDVSVVTGKLSGCSADTRVYMTLIGSRGRSGKFELKAARASGKSSFPRGSTKTFCVTSTSDVGSVNKIRIEHDGDMAVRWHLMLVLVREIDSGRRTLFKCNQVLAEEEGNARWRELLGHTLSADSADSLDKYIPKGLDSLYELEVRTGAMPYAGTNANVTVQLIGQSGRKTRPIGLPHSSLNHANAFERGQTDVFRVTAADVGDIQKLAIGHDNTGLSPGWFLEQVIVRKFSSAPTPKEKRIVTNPATTGDQDEELTDANQSGDGSGRLRRGDSNSSPSGSRKNNRRAKESRKPSKNRRSNSPNTDDRSDEDSDDEQIEEEEQEEELAARREGAETRHKSRRSSQRRQPSSDDDRVSSDADEDDAYAGTENAVDRESNTDMDRALATKQRLERMYRKARLTRPRVYECTFFAGRWLATDEGDRQIQLELPVRSQRTFEA